MSTPKFLPARNFLQHILRRGLECLEETSKTITHDIPHGESCDGSETLKLFKDDFNIVWRHIDTILTEDRRHATAVLEDHNDLFAAVAATTITDPNFIFYYITFLYYRSHHGILASATSMLLTLHGITSAELQGILLIQFHFGTVASHDDPNVPSFLNLPAVMKRFRKGSSKSTFRCYNMTHGATYVIAPPFLTHIQ
ncbi:hypothetical protein JTB14_001345 [Gonioctena quinquepunctata]|nr:hypothetical protein JTB14_001345 [Gonioctena quinquepunctata]